MSFFTAQSGSRPNHSPPHLGRKIPHPSSTNFDYGYDEDDYSHKDNTEFPTPAAKRLRLEQGQTLHHDSSAIDPLGGDAEIEEVTRTAGLDHTTNSSRQIEVLGSEEDDADGNGEERLPDGGTKHTDLETSLPAVQTDAEAIAAYEAFKASEEEQIPVGSSARDTLESRSWRKSRSSIYVDAFNLTLDTVLEDEGHLFDEAELGLFAQWRSLSYESQYLYVRLFLRKTSAWHRIGRLRYYRDIADLDAAVADLQQERALPPTSHLPQAHPGELEPPEGTTLGRTFQFAQCSSDHITTLDEASGLLLLDELKAVAKEAKVAGKNKKELLTALRQTSGKQSGLGFHSLRRSETQESTASDSNVVDLTSDAEDKEDRDSTSNPSGIAKGNRDAHFTHKILHDITGKLIRLSLAPLKLFERVHLVFYRSTEWTEKSLTTLILAKISRRNFPNYTVSRSVGIFPNREMLLEFEAAIRLQFRVDGILEFNGPPGRKGFEEVREIFEEVYPRWRVLVAEERAKEEWIYESGEGAYLRRFSPAWVYTRIVHKGCESLGRFKEYRREWEVLTELLDQCLFHASRRGAWYQRRALLEEHYMWALPDEPSGPSKDDEARIKKHWKRVALRTCEMGLQDRQCHLIFHYDLQKRIRKLERSLKVPVREQHQFGHVGLGIAYEREVDGVQIVKSGTLEPGNKGQGPKSSDIGPPLKRTTSGNSTKTVWLDELDTNGFVSVEAMCLSWYRKQQGWKGFHAEGGVLRTLFGLLFFDVLFAYVPNVFQTAYQTCPLDLHTDSFYAARASEIQRRIIDLENGNAEAILRAVWQSEGPDDFGEKGEIEVGAGRRTCIIGVRWDEYALEDLCDICACFGGRRLGVVMLVLAQEYRVRGGGVPDLLLWRRNDQRDLGWNDSDEAAGEVMFVEVKSASDRVSDTQRLWIHVLLDAGIPVELCHAVAREIRVQR